MKRRVVLSARAEAQLDAIYRYVLQHSGESRADALAVHLLTACYGLALFPERGTRRDDLFPGLGVMGVRRLATIAFTVHGDMVVIQGVLGRGQDVAHILNKDP